MKLQVLNSTRRGCKHATRVVLIVACRVRTWVRSKMAVPVLNTCEEEGEEGLKHNVHFCIDVHSTRNEYGTAAYQTVELDAFLN